VFFKGRLHPLRDATGIGIFFTTARRFFARVRFKHDADA
jgi:hypothetical protein